MSGSNCCFLTCTQISEEAGKVAWYPYLFQNFQQFVVIHIVKGFCVVNEAEVDTFLEFPGYFLIQRMLAIWSLVPVHLKVLGSHVIEASVQLLSHVWLFQTPWTAARQASLSITRPPCPSPTPRGHPNPCPFSWWCHPNISSCCLPLLLPPSIFPSIRVFSNESALHIRWPKDWSFSFNISPSNEHPGLISFRMEWLDLLAVQGTLKSLLQRHSSKSSILPCSAFFIVQPSHPYMTIGKNHNLD